MIGGIVLFPLLVLKTVFHLGKLSKLKSGETWETVQSGDDMFSTTIDNILCLMKMSHYFISLWYPLELGTFLIF